MAKISINLSKGQVEQKPTAPLIVGIDLGTTNSLIAYMQNGKPVCVKNATHQNTLIPSVVYFNQQNETVVGETAKKMLVLQPEQTIASVKRLMGKSYQDVLPDEWFFSYQIIDDKQENSLVKIKIAEHYYNPVELSALILKELKQTAEQNLGQSVEKCVITVPAYFNDAQRQATRDAGKLAGLDVLRIVNEPTAASLAYGFGTNQQDAKTIVVYDLGGGTFDVSILRLEQGVFEVLSTNGDTFLGGDDIDRGIVEFWNSKYQLLSAEDLKNKQKVQSLKALAEQAKKLLSSQTSVELVYEQQVLQITSADFETIVQKIIQKTLVCCKRALEDAELSKNEIDEVIMVGGSTRIGLIKSAVTNFFGKEVNDRVNPDEIVALGAAIQADILAGNQKDSLLLDITPLSLGIETLGGLMDTIISRNSKIPTSMARQYTTSVDGQKNLKVAVYQGERELVAHNRLLGELVLKGIPPMPAGLPKIEIQFLLNADGILQVKAKELRSGVETSIDIRSTYGISGEEMGKMLLDSVKNAATDMQMRGLIEAQTEAQGVLLATSKFIKQNTAILTEAQTEEIQRLAEILQTQIEKGDKHQIMSAMDVLNAYAAPIAQIAMDNLIGASMKGSKIGE